MAIRKIGDVERVDSIAAEDGILLERGGALKRIDAEQVGGTSKMAIFTISATESGVNIIAKSDGVTFASADEILDAYFAGNGYVYARYGLYKAEDGETSTVIYAPGKIIGFRISGKYSDEVILYFHGGSAGRNDAKINDLTNEQFKAKLDARMAQMGVTPQ